MYSKVPSVLGATTGAVVLPNTGSNRLLFVAAISLLAVGVVAFVTSFVAARKG
ncbi:LPXTG cell wall anchor domain-containing protein [Candidatus Saccharibacteria bacterium]|nr:LPXTG cell wall anchor domain-containing protein [Candidatus Saccharibacteria bacterium]